MTPILDFARVFWDLGLSPIPLGHASAGSLGKLPKEKNWQVFCVAKATEDRLADWEAKLPDSNIGLCTGIEVLPGWCLAAVDIDDERHQEVVERAIGSLVSGKRGQKGATWFCLVQPDTKSRSFKMTKALGGGTLVDFLAIGKQTVVPPSIHPDTGEPYVWLGTPLHELGDLANLPKLGPGFLLELGMIAAGKDALFNGGLTGPEGQEIEIDGLNNMVWAGVGGGGTTHDNRLRCSGFMISMGWPEEEAVDRLDRAMYEAFERGATDEEPNWDSIHNEHVKMVRGAIDKGFGDKKQKTTKKAMPAERTLADWGMQHFAPITFVDGKFRKYENGYWPEIKPGVIKKAMLEIDMSIKNADVNTAVAVMETLLDDPSFGKGDAERICLQNGTIDTRTGSLLQHDPDHQCLHQLDFAWDPEAKCPVYDKFIDWVFMGGQKEIAAWDEFCGLSLVPDLKFQKMVYLLGPGANGKSTLSYLLTSVHAASAVSTVPITSLDEERQRTALVGSYLNVSTEQSRLNTVADAVFKQIVGGDPVSTRRLFKEVDNGVVLTARLLCLANELPATNDTSFAMRRRMIILECPNIIKDEDKDPDLIHKLKAERPAVLRRWVEALRRLRARNRFDEPESSTAAVDTYLREQDSVAQWLEARCTQVPGDDPKGWPTVEECFTEYHEYSKNMGYRNPYTLPVFKAKLKNVGIKVLRNVAELGNVTLITEQIGIKFKDASRTAMAQRL